MIEQNESILESSEPSSKRRKILPSLTATPGDLQTQHYCLHELIDIIQKSPTKINGDNSQSSREAAVGIKHYVNPKCTGFSGTLKKRYSDFIVNEIALDGTVYHLTDVQVPVEISTICQTLHAKESSKTTKPQSCEKSERSEPTTFASTLKISEQPANSRHEVLDLKPNQSNDKQCPAVDATPKPQITPEDEEDLFKLFGEEKKNEILQLHQRIIAKPAAKSSEFGSILTLPIQDRQLRGQMHQALRRIFKNLLESSFDESSKGIRILAASKKSRNTSDRRNANPRNEKQLNGKVGWNERGGEYLHMSLFKQDRDTMEVVSYMARQLKVKPHVFSYAGTKDRRAVTTQRVSAYRLTAETVVKINENIYNATVGNFKYEKQPLELGELKGNLFTITLRECQLPSDDSADLTQRCQKIQEVLESARQTLVSSGFINYYGLQRFGTFEIGTHTIGMLILQGDYARAVACILKSHPDVWCSSTEQSETQNPRKQVNKDELDRAQAIRGFGSGEMKLEEALTKLPRRFSAERNILQHLKTRNGKDYLGALLSVPRNLRLMYVHAYQSFVWNEVASERWAKYNNNVITGDLVLIESKSQKTSLYAQFDDSGEVIVQPAAHDISVSRDVMFERARALSSDEAVSGKFTISDIVLPLPGFDVEYPANEIGQFYKTFMASEKGGGLDPVDMRRKQKDFSLSGSYRKLIATVSNFGYTTKIYRDENEQLVPTDLDKIVGKRPRENSNYVASTETSVTKVSDSKPNRKSNVCNLAPRESNSYGLSVEKLPHLFEPDTTEDVKNIALQENVTCLKEISHCEMGINIPTSIDTSDFSLITQSPAPVIPPATLTKENQAPSISKNSNFTVSQSIAETFVTNGEGEAKIGVVLWFDLSSSQYATMLLREIMGSDNVCHYQPEFGTRKP
ncbi:Multisubstrate pseudouridine synthase 7 [Golovinomyces cichoracearum]|uniref:Multisubstrate pseudouridine synthase 7 n=1 Tax=Golovinomyces cichoracearum TaxID=62708 RepID=A0A420IDZ3_9PEZI|nr:Multisubstrate pseudouridine synthase 7 [Golovinomyces cichoracearum]